MTSKSGFGHRQTGTVLVFSMIILLSLTLIALTAVNTSVTGLRVAFNAEEDMNAFQTAQAAVDAVIADTANLPMAGPLDIPNPVSITGDPFTIDSGAGESLSAHATRTIDCGLPPRTSDSSSLLAFSAFNFRIGSDVDKSATGRGRSSLRLGYILLGPKC